MHAVDVARSVEPRPLLRIRHVRDASDARRRVAEGDQREEVVPTRGEELLIVKNTTSAAIPEVKKVLNAEQIIYFQQLVRNIPVTDHVLEYAVKLVSKTRPTVRHQLGFDRLR